MSFAPQYSQGNYLPENIVLPDDNFNFKEFLKITLEEHARFINRKDMGQYETIEIQNNQTFPGTNPQNKNFIYRKIISTGVLPNTATSIIPHGIAAINNNWLFTRLYGSARDPNLIDFIPMPNGGPNLEVELRVNNTNIYITTSANLTRFTYSYVILEFYKG